MRALRMIFATLSAASVFTANLAHACMSIEPPDLSLIKDADVVVIGRISNYEVVIDPIRQEILQDQLNQYENAVFVDHDGLQRIKDQMKQSDQARFEMQIDQVLVGEAPHRISVVWSTPNITVPDDMSGGPYLVPLRHKSSASNGEVGLGTFGVLQPPCTYGFIFPGKGDVPDKILKTLQH